MFKMFNKEEITPEIGDVYYFIPNEGTPFCENKKVFVTVIDIKEGYIKYKNGTQ